MSASATAGHGGTSPFNSGTSSALGLSVSPAAITLLNSGAGSLAKVLSSIACCDTFRGDLSRLPVHSESMPFSAHP